MHQSSSRCTQPCASRNQFSKALFPAASIPLISGTWDQVLASRASRPASLTRRRRADYIVYFLQHQPVVGRGQPAPPFPASALASVRRDGGRLARRNDAFRALVARYEAPLLGYLRKLGDGDMEHAKDLLGPVFSKAYRWLTEHNESCRSLGGLLYKVARNTALDDLCKTSTDPLDGALELNEELVGLPIAPAPSENNAATQARDAALAEVIGAA